MMAARVEHVRFDLGINTDFQAYFTGSVANSLLVNMRWIIVDTTQASAAVIVIIMSTSAVSLEESFWKRWDHLSSDECWSVSLYKRVTLLLKREIWRA